MMPSANLDTLSAPIRMVFEYLNTMVQLMDNSNIEKLISSLKERDFSKAIALVGSYARDPTDKHNDIDVYIITNTDWRQRKTFVVNDTAIECFFNSIDWVKWYFGTDQWDMHYRWLINANIKYDPEEMFTELRSYAEEKKNEKVNLTKEEREAMRYLLWDYKQDIQSTEGIQKKYVLNRTFDKVVRKLIEVNSEVPVKDNYRIQKLKQIDSLSYQLATEFLQTHSTDKRESILDQLIQILSQEVGTPRPELCSERQLFADRTEPHKWPDLRIEEGKNSL